jgi:hypothetical protein
MWRKTPKIHIIYYLIKFGAQNLLDPNLKNPPWKFNGTCLTWLQLNYVRKSDMSSQWTSAEWWKKPERTTDPGQATDKLYHLQMRVECTLLCNLQSRVQNPCRIGDRFVWAVNKKSIDGINSNPSRAKTGQLMFARTNYKFARCIVFIHVSQSVSILRTPLLHGKASIAILVSCNFFYPAISIFAVQICYANKFLLYSY